MDRYSFHWVDLTTGDFSRNLTNGMWQMRWNYCPRLLSESKDKYKQHNVTAVSHHQAATWVFSLKKKRKKKICLWLMPLEQKSKLLACADASTAAQTLRWLWQHQRWCCTTASCDSVWESSQIHTHRVPDVAERRAVFRMSASNP